jgi:hypothetical protein
VIVAGARKLKRWTLLYLELRETRS